MTLIADFLLVAGSLAAAFYCMVLSRRLRRLSSLDAGLGGAIAVLSAQVDDMTKVLEKTRAAAQASARDLTALSARADATAARLELLMAAQRDVSPKGYGAAAAGPSWAGAAPQDDGQMRRARVLVRKPRIAEAAE
jgi:hypothetical protein